MCILLNVKKHEKTFALNVDIFKIRNSRKNHLQPRNVYDIVDNGLY